MFAVQMTKSIPAMDLLAGEVFAAQVGYRFATYLIHTKEGWELVPQSWAQVVHI